jgi:hypothetical protein
MSYFAGAADIFEREGMRKKRRTVVLMASSLTTAAVLAGRGGANRLAELTGRFKSLETAGQSWMAK